MSEQTTAGALESADAVDATQGGLTTYVPQALVTAANTRIAELEADKKAAREDAEHAQAALAERDRMLRSLAELLIRTPRTPHPDADDITRYLNGVRTICARAEEGIGT